MGRMTNFQLWLIQTIVLENKMIQISDVYFDLICQQRIL